MVGEFDGLKIGMIRRVRSVLATECEETVFGLEFWPIDQPVEMG